MNKIKDKIKVAVIVPVFAHYRRDLYNHLLKSNDFDFNFISGQQYLNIKTIDNFQGKTFKYFSFSLLKHKFYYLKGSLQYIFKLKPDVIISSGVDFHLIHTILLFLINLIFLRKRFYWWSQGTIGHQGKFGWLMRKFVYKNATGLLLYSHSGRSNLLDMGVKEANMAVVNNCLNSDDYGFLNYDIKEHKKTRKEFNILFSGRLIEKAKLEILFLAIKEFVAKDSNIKCNIIGGGDIEKYKKLVDEYNINQYVEFLGSKYGKDAHSYFLGADLFIYPGGIGLSILHALSFGLPVITTDNYNLHFPEIELLEKGKNGDVYEHDNVLSMTNKIYHWKNTIQASRNQIIGNCIQVIHDLGYLPDKESAAILKFLKQHN